ncbi:MAG: hypothetical protein FJ395_18990 [Verrucomicrobia bacterium]|nr:hypothetical protein [Verrucomicrobiota bacterium]
MKLRTQFNEWHEINGLWQVMAALSLLGSTEQEDSFLVCDNETGGFFQVAKWQPGQYIVEWCDSNDPTSPEHGLWRAQTQRFPGALLESGNKETGQANLYENDLLSLPDVLDVLAAFWHGGDWPRRLSWRSLAAEMKEFIQFNDDKHGRMTLTE